MALRTTLLALLLLPSAALAQAAPVPEAPGADTGPELHLSLVVNPLGVLREAIVAARHSIDAVFYKFDEKSLSPLLDAAVERGVRVRLVADAGEARRGRSRVGRAARDGVSVRLWKSGKLHAKFVVVDGVRAVSGSYNWTESAQHDNVELLMDFAEPETIDRFEALFDELWTRSEAVGR